MSTLLTLTSHETIGIYIACPLILILFLIAVYYVLNGFRKESEWEDEVREMFKREDQEDN